MTYTEILDAVVSLTNREDMAAEIQTAIQASTLRVHQSDYYSRDVTEDTITLAGTDYLHSISIQAMFPRFRAVKYLRKWDPTGIDPISGLPTGLAGAFFDVLDPEAIMDTYGVNKENIYYVTGGALQLRSSTQISSLLAGWYQSPKISPVGQFSSWIAEVVPHAIIFDACSIIFQMVAQQEQSRKFDALVAEQMSLVRMQHAET